MKIISTPVSKKTSMFCKKRFSLNSLALQVALALKLLFYQIIQEWKGDETMVAYEYYWRDVTRGYELIGVLPERRRNISRVSQKSIVGLGKKFWGDHIDSDKVIFIRIKVDKMTGEISRPKPPLGFDFEE